MANETISLIIPGVRVTAAPEPDLRQLLTITPVSSHVITPPSRGEAAPESVVNAPADCIVKLEYASGLTEWLRVDQFRSELGQSRSDGPVRVPATLDRGASGPSRSGATGWVLKAMHVFGISPTTLVATETANLVVKHFDGNLKTGVYKLQPDGSFGATIQQPLTDVSRPYLVFIHGTASSTQGSFSGFWQDEQTKKPTAEWNNLVTTYGDRILALEHATLSLSPAQNALDLIHMLPQGATLHVVTHSRGGLVGELLGLGALSPRDLSLLRGRPDEELLWSLSAELGTKSLNVSKFVRTACPAAGTILASKRLDLYLNIILNVLGLIPGLSANPAYEVFKATALELIKLRADPSKIPGIEAQMPESPLIHLLNTKGRFSKADLGVIAGDFEGSGVWGTLKDYALRAYYREDNDFVVNTKSMSGGMDRESGVQQFLDRGAKVNHFSYFKNPSTRSHMLSWLSTPMGKPVLDFTRVRGITDKEQASASRGAELLPVAFLVPDVFGTNLAIGDQNLWLDYDALGQGRLKDLTGADVKPGTVHEFYKPLFTKLALSHDAVAFAYDWRQAISKSAEALADAVKAKLTGSTRSVRFIAHGAGGLVVREFARLQPDLWKQLTADGGGLLMVGTPNFGSWRIAKILAGRSRFVRMLGLLGGQSDAEVAAVFRGFRGLLDLLPDEAFDNTRWQTLGVERPDRAQLDASRKWRQSLGNAVPAGQVWYVAGSALATPSGFTEYTSAGDGDVTYELGVLPSVKTWYNPDASHGGLVAQPDALIEILTKGRTSSLDTRVHPVAAQPPDALLLSEHEEAVLFPSESDLVNAAFERPETPSAVEDRILRVRVVHGNLREARHPLAVGHYIGDSIVSAEAQLDQQLEGRLSTRFHVDIYPGRVGTAEVVLVPRSNPPGALVVGLGEVGEITPERVRRGVLEGCLRYALFRAEDKPDPNGAPHSAAFSSLLIGVSGGRAISIADSVTSIVRAALEANRLLKHWSLYEKVRIDEVEFVELYEDAAIEATQVAAHLPEYLKNDLEPGERVEFDQRMRSLQSGRFLRRMNEYDTGWWRRIQIASDRCGNTTSSSSTALVFESLTDRARAEEALAANQTDLVNALLDDATRQPSFDEDTAVALFELLVPNSLKDQAPEKVPLVLVVDNEAARYPWEFMARRAGDKVLPISVEAGIVRQLKVTTTGPGPRSARESNALVIGDTKSDLPELKHAQDEAQAVADMLEQRAYKTNLLIRQDPQTIVRRLFAHEYRIVHLAGHGIYNPKDPSRSGMVLSRGVYLTPLELCQIRHLPELVFINCCHLGNIDRDGLNVWSPHRMAASISQALIARGVKAVVAAGWAVNDAAALIFAKSFYEQMLSGGKFGESVKEARQAARSAGSNNTWGAYQCYGNPDFTLSLQARSSYAPRTFYSRREWLDELKDISASATGLFGDALSPLVSRAEGIDTIPSQWRDGEVLFAAAEAYKALGNFELAIERYDEAIKSPVGDAPVKAIEQLANVRDRRAGQLFASNPELARKMWGDAESSLAGLNQLLGKTGERLALLAANWKRRGERDPENRSVAFQKASQYYKEAYEQNRRVNGKADPYSGLNAIALAYLSGDTSSIPADALEEAKRDYTEPSFWERVYKPDALLLEHLLKGDLKDHTDEIVEGYKDALQFAAPNQKDSVLGQVRFLARMLPDNGALSNLDAALSA